MNLSKIVSLMLVLSFLIITQALHLQQTQNSQLTALKDQQNNLGQQVDNLLQTADSVKQQVETASNSSQKVSILQSAIDKQKQYIFDLKNSLVPPFNESSTACKQLTETQKKNLLAKIKVSRQKLAKLQQINNNLNQDLLQVQKINESIIKQQAILQSMQQTIQTKCKLSPTIFQSNLKAPNWILGAQTMSTLQNQYSSRALLFSNITNCPIETPFYSLAQELCVQCLAPTPFWNMFTKECVGCGIDQEIDSKTRNCKVKPHYTNFTKLGNWNLQGGVLPTVDVKLTPCEDIKPYFNGVICTKCQLPKYWSVSANLCKKCQNGSTFDMNTKQCQKIVPSQLTILQNTSWVTTNITKVIQQRVNVLNQNQTSGKYQYCQDISKPFFDGATCISCQYFDIDTKKCLQLPKGSVYNANMRQFVAPQSGKQTNINATRYISSNKLSDTNLPNCNNTHQFYDNTACIQCAKPFDIFSIDDNKCISCNSNQIFIQSNHTCTSRQTIYISQNFDRLIATSKVTIPQYKQSIVTLINANPQAIVVPCKDKEYSNTSSCFNCQDNQYFNVQLLKCVQCDGTYNDKSNTCNGTIYIFTNLKAKNIVDMQGLTVDQQNQRISDFLSTHPGSYVCSIEKPYAIENKTCGTCKQLFSYSSFKCTSCQQYEVYVAANRDCQQATMLVNFTDSHLILVTSNQTLSSFKLAQQQISNQNLSLAKTCPGPTPYTSDRKSCYNCSNDSPYFNYTTKQCTNCPDSYVFDSVQVMCVQKYYITLINNQTTQQMIGSTGYTLDNYVQDQNRLKKSAPFQLCTADTPFGTTFGCQQCVDPTPYFDIKKSVCSSANKVINFSSIGQNYTIAQGKTLSNYQSSQNDYKSSSQSLTIQCSKDTPFTNDHSYCFNCTDPTYLFDFQTKSCIACDSTETFSKDQKKCIKLSYITNFNDVTKMVGSSTYTLNDFKTEQNNLKSAGPYILCNTTQPYGSTDGCLQCTAPQQYFDIKNKICTQIKWYTNLNASNSSFITGANKTIQDYQQSQTSQISSSNIPTLICPLTTAFTSDGKTCSNCNSTKGQFNLQTNQCQTCDSTSKYDPSTNKCIKTQYYTLFTPTTESKILVSSDSTLQNYKDNQKAIQNSVGSSQCTTATPYSTQTGCIACGVGLYFDVNSQQCASCPAGTQFLTASNTCQAVSYLTNYSNPFIKVSNNYSLGQAKQAEQDRATGKIAVNCTDPKPYATSTGCISCASPLQYFNIQSMTCEKGCIDFYQYFKDNMCRDYIVLTNTKQMHGFSEVNNYTKYNVQKMNNFTYIKNQPYVIDCPTDKPFYTGSLCIACTPNTPIFNLQSLSCQASSTILKTNLTSIKYYIQQPGYTLQDENDQIKYLTKMNVPVTYCPSARPYLSNTECIDCPDEQKYFDFAEEICKECLPGLLCKSA